MNESIDSISNFFNKLLNIKSKDTSARDQPTNQRPISQSTSTSKDNANQDQTLKATSKTTTINYLKAGLSDILDETSEYLNSIKANSTENIHQSAASRSPAKSQTMHDHSVKQISQPSASRTFDAGHSSNEPSNEPDVQVAIDLTNEQDVQRLFNKNEGLSKRTNQTANHSNSLQTNSTNESSGERLNKTSPFDALKMESKSDGHQQHNLSNEQRESGDHLRASASTSEQEGKRLSIGDKKQVNESSTIRNDSNGANLSEANERKQHLIANETASGVNELRERKLTGLTLNSTIEQEFVYPNKDDHLPGENDSLSDACFIPPALFNNTSTDTQTFEVINLETAKDVKNDAEQDEHSLASDERPNNDAENDLEQAQLPKTAKIFFQKSSKHDSSENLKSKSKIKSSLLSVIKSDKSKSIEKCSTKPKISDQQLTNGLVNDDYLNNVSNGCQSLNKVKKSSSFSSTTSLATTSSSDNINTTNKENDCELSNLMNEFSDSFKLINQSLLGDPLDEGYSKSRTTKLNSNPHSFVAASNASPPKPPTRARSTSKLNKAYQDNVNSSTIVVSNSHAQEPIKCSTIKITNQPVSIVNCSPSDGLTNAASVDLSERSNRCRLTISVQANDQPTTNLEQTKLVNCKNDQDMKAVLNGEFRTSDLKSEMGNENQPVEQVLGLTKNGTFIKSNEKQPTTNNGLWSTTDSTATSCISNLNKSKRSKSVKQLGSNRLFNDIKLSPIQSNASSRTVQIEQQVVRKSNTMHFDHLRSLDRLKNNTELFDRRSVKPTSDTINDRRLDRRSDKQRDKPDRDRSVNESVDKLVSKSISRLADKSLTNLSLNNQSQVRLADRLLNEIVRNKSCSSLYQQRSVHQSVDSSSNLGDLSAINRTAKRSRIPYSKSSVTLSRPIDACQTLKDYSNDYSSELRMMKNSSSSESRLPNANKILTDNCLDVSSSSSSCSLCTSLSADSLESCLNKKDSNHTGSLSNLNSSSDRDFEHLQVRTSQSMSKINQKLDSLMGKSRIPRMPNQFRFDGQTRSLTSLTGYNLAGYTNRRVLNRTNSNHLFQPSRELSRIDENSLEIKDSLDDDQLSAQHADAGETQKSQSNRLVSNWLDDVENRPNDELDRLQLTTSPINQSTINCRASTNQTNSSSLISSSSLDNLHGMDESSELTINKSSCNTSCNTASLSTSCNTSCNTSYSTSTCNTSTCNTSTCNTSCNTSNPTSNTSNQTMTNARPTLNQFKSSLINQLIDSNSQLKNDLCNELSNNRLDDSLRQTRDESDLETSTIGSLNDTQQNIFNSKKSLYAKSKLMKMNKTDSCRSFEMNERIVDLEMQLTVHKTKFNESLNLIKVLSDHCNDLIVVFNESYNHKLTEIGDLTKENQRLAKQNDEYKSLLKRNLNQEFNQIFNQKHEFNRNPPVDSSERNYLEQYKELEVEYDKLRSTLDYSRQSEQQLSDELNNLKIKFQQNYELYERVKQRSLEKVESANKMIENANKNNDRELVLAKMQVKKSELKIQKLESELELKIKENLELNQLLDSLK